MAGAIYFENKRSLVVHDAAISQSFQKAILENGLQLILLYDFDFK